MAVGGFARGCRGPVAEVQQFGPDDPACPRTRPHAWYGEDYHLHEKTVAEVPALEYYQSKGVRALLHSCIWNAFGYVSPLGHEDQFRELVDTWHRYDIGVIPYVMGFLLSERAPECLFFRDEMTRSPLTEFPIVFPGLPPETDYITCHNSIWGDFAVDGIARLFDEYDIDGVERYRPCRR